MEKACLVCGISFKPLRPDAKYCSRPCYHKSRVGHAPTNPKRRQINQCEACGASFETGGRSGKHRWAKYCSRECAGHGAVQYGPPRQLTIEQAAYLAGFFDGEGSIVKVRRAASKPAYRVVIYQSDEAVIRRIAEVTGTGLVSERIIRTSNLPLSPRGHKRQFFWQLYGRNAAALLRQLLPYLIVKRGRAIEAIEAQELAPAT